MVSESRDLGKAAQFAARTFTFTFDDKTLRTAYKEMYGEGMLSTSDVGWLTVDESAKTLTLKDSKGKERSYEIRELSADKLVIVPSGGSVTRNAQLVAP